MYLSSFDFPLILSGLAVFNKIMRSTYITLTSHLQVEGEAQGEEENVKKLLKDVDRGPPHARVVKLEKNEIELVDGETTFEVRRS